MLVDLAESAIGLLLCPLIFVLPGYVLGQISGVLDFRSQSIMVQVAMALMLSVAIGPIVLYMLLLLGWWAVWMVYGASWVVAAGLLVRKRPSATPLLRPALVGLGVAILFVVLQMDIGWGDRLYFSTAARDFVRTIALSHEAAAHGVPPLNPMFYPGEGIPLFYYYGWMLVTSFLDTIGGVAVGPRGAVFAGTAFCALALAGTVVSYVATLSNPLVVDSSALRPDRRKRLAVLLLIVGGLDILMFLAGAAVLKMAGRPVIFTDMEWWNEPVLMWITSVLTVPHHVAGLIAGLAGLRLARWSVAATGGRRRGGALLLAGGAFASSVLCSIWIGMAMALVGAVWVGLSILGRRWEEVRGWLTAGLLAGLFALPFILYLRSAGTVEGFPVSLGIRPFGPMEHFFGFARIGREAFVHLPFLPVSYALEYGFFALAGVLFWWLRKREALPLTQDERLLRVILAVGLLFPAFAMATVRNNDLGFRAPMLAQFILLLWAADLLGALRQGTIRLPKTWLRPALAILLVVGVVSNISNALIMRFVTPAADAGLISMPGMYGDDQELGARTKALREAYVWVRTHTSESAIIQHNPQPGVVRREGGFAFAPALYGHRHAVAYDDDMGTMYGVTHSVYDPVAEEVASVFEQPDAANAAAVASRWGIDAFVVDDRDPVWDDTTSWVWIQPADFSNERVRVFLDPVRMTPDAR